MFTLIIPVLLWRLAEAPSPGGGTLMIRRLIPLFALLLLAGLAPVLLPTFHVTLLNLHRPVRLVALGLVLLTGVGGMTSFGQAAFVGLGAYATARC
ncbi:MAG: hypothetical protein LKM38_30405 [Pseudomonas veronii]|nr:hypothetical protein [Pseudomonas veronii]